MSASTTVRWDQGRIGTHLLVQRLINDTWRVIVPGDAGILAPLSVDCADLDEVHKVGEQLAPLVDEVVRLRIEASEAQNRLVAEAQELNR